MRQDVEFQSEGATLRGWLYSSAETSKRRRPAVIMAHGFSATRHMTTDQYALVLLEAGFTVLLYDHRNFGASDGEPRRQINPWIQARGYRDAISYLSGRDDIHPKGIAIWGDSLSGGVALAVAAVDERVAALVVQVPACGPELPPDDPDGRRFRALADTIARGDVNPSPDDVQGPMPVVSDDQVRRPSALQPLTAYRWFIEYGGRLGTQWVNDVTRAQPRTPEPWQPGLCAAYVRCPTIFLVSPAEEMKNAAPTVARHAFERLRGPKEWIDIEGGHFGLLYYPSAEFDRASSAQARFLAVHLGRLSE